MMKRKSIKRKASVMLTNCMNHSNYSIENFEAVGTFNGYFIIDEAVEALREIMLKRELNETTQQFVNYSQNTLKIVLGLAIVYQNDILFNEIYLKLGDCIAPFSCDFRQALGDFNPDVRSLLELTLKACLVTNDFQDADNVI